MTLLHTLPFRKIIFTALLAVPAFFLFASPAYAECTVMTMYLYGFPFTFTVGDCSTTTASPTASLTATPSVIFKGSSASLSWSSTNASSCTGTNFSTGNKISGSLTVKPASTTSYTVTCTGGGKSATASRTVNVTVPSSSGSGSGASLGGGGQLLFGGSFAIAPVCTPTLSSDKTTIIKGTGAKLTWSSLTLYNVTSGPFVTISNVGSVSPASGGSVSVSPTKTTSYTATCTVTGGIAGAFTTSRSSNPVTITVTEPVFGSCSASPSSITSGQSSTWTANPSGGNGTYTYSWSGTNSLSGTTKSVMKTYTSTGTKTASVQITSAGSSKTIGCSNSVTVTNQLPQCGDGVDNDGDGKIDSADFGCSTPSDTTESPNPQCSDGVDNDGDGKTDNADFGCYTGSGSRSVYSPTKTSESPNPQCSDGIDNNGNGKVDYPLDAACSSAFDNNEEVLPNASLSLTSLELLPFDTAATLSWSAKDVKANSCTLSGTNGDSWNLTGASGTKITSELAGEAIFTLSCKDLNGDPVSTSTTIKIVPDFQEL